MFSQSLNPLLVRLVARGLSPLAVLHQLGIEIELRGNHLHARHPRWPVLMTPDVDTFIRANTRSIAAELNQARKVAS